MPQSYCVPQEIFGCVCENLALSVPLSPLLPSPPVPAPSQTTHPEDPILMTQSYPHRLSVVPHPATIT